MNHIKALLIKFVMIAVVLLVVLTLLFDVEFGDTLAISAVLTLVAYVLGDLMVFRKKEHQNTAATAQPNDQKKRNLMATIGDVVIAFLIVWLMGDALTNPSDNILEAALISALAVGAGEWFFHKYLDRHVFHYRNPNDAQNPATASGHTHNH